MATSTYLCARLLSRLRAVAVQHWQVQRVHGKSLQLMQQCGRQVRALTLPFLASEQDSRSECGRLARGLLSKVDELQLAFLF